MSLTKLEYELIKYTINDEPLHILIGGFATDIKNEKLFKALIHLIKIGYLECFSSNKSQPRPLKLTDQDLKEYLKIRRKFKEKLDEYPAHCWEYNFCATEQGIKQINKKDKKELGI